MGARLLRVLILGLIGAGIVHIVVLFLVPVYSDQNAWSRISALGDTYRFHRLKAVSDPLFMQSACRFDLDDGALRITAKGEMPYWSMSIYNRKGDNLYSFNDSIFNEQPLDLVIADPASLVRLKADIPANLEQAIMIAQNIDEGIVVLRVFAPDATWATQISKFFNDAQCIPIGSISQL
ncbi:hypothetical protein G3A39_42610 [Paraburkholderia aspalathi]|nr:hypothetical protein [Paraburkholderia aspalathi]